VTPPCKSGVLALGLLAASLAAACSSVAPESAPGPAAASIPGAVANDGAARLLITLHAGPPQMWQRTLGELQANYELRPLALWPMASLGVPCAVLEVPAGRDPDRLAASVAADPRVESAQAVRRFRVLASADPPIPPAPPAAGADRPKADPYERLQHAAQELHLVAAHRRATGRGVKVAVVDTGVDFRHPDLMGRIVAARDFVSRNGGGDGTFTADVHGTGVAGVIAASAGNGIGILGVAPEAEVLAVKSCWPEGSGPTDAACDSYTLAQGLDFAIDQGARIINLSLTGPHDPLLARLVAAALERKIVVVAARAELEDPGFPASEAGVLAVGAKSTADLPGDIGAAPFLAAPGVDILTTVPGEGYDFLSGSSMAAAQVSGVAALLLQHRPGLSPAEVSFTLARTAHPSNPHGAPVVDACAAVADVLGPSAGEMCDD
jgi:subtilisin family serine protease